MRIEPVTNQYFTSGKVKLVQINENPLLNKEVLEAIADKNGIDIYVKKAQENTKYLPNNDSYLIFVSKEMKTPPFVRHGVGVALTKKSDADAVVTGKVFGAIHKALERLNNKLINNKT